MVRHGSPIIMLGALLAIAAGGIMFALEESLLTTLAAAALVLLATAVIANRPSEYRRRVLAKAPPPAAQPTATAIPLSQPTFLAGTALAYLTLGALTLIWTGVWWYYLRDHPPVSLLAWYVCYGLLGTGLVLVILAPLLGRIGRMAREAEMPPPEVSPPVAGVDQTGTAVPPVGAVPSSSNRIGSGMKKPR